MINERNECENELRTAYNRWFMERYADEGLCNGNACLVFEESHSDKILDDVKEVLGL